MIVNLLEVQCLKEMKIMVVIICHKEVKWKVRLVIVVILIIQIKKMMKKTIMIKKMIKKIISILIRVNLLEVQCLKKMRTMVVIICHKEVKWKVRLVIVVILIIQIKKMMKKTIMIKKMIKKIISILIRVNLLEVQCLKKMKIMVVIIYQK